MKATIERTCERCGKQFTALASEVRRGNGKVCSRYCCPGRLKPRPDEAKSKIRANGLVNMRIRRGRLNRPEQCQKCGKRGRIDAHHPDYGKPAEVQWLCRSCHMKTHWEEQGKARGLVLLEVEQ